MPVTEKSIRLHLDESLNSNYFH